MSRHSSSYSSSGQSSGLLILVAAAGNFGDSEPTLFTRLLSQAILSVAECSDEVILRLLAGGGPLFCDFGKPTNNASRLRVLYCISAAYMPGRGRTHYLTIIHARISLCLRTGADSFIQDSPMTGILTGYKAFCRYFGNAKEPLPNSKF